MRIAGLCLVVLAACSPALSQEKPQDKPDMPAPKREAPKPVAINAGGKEFWLWSAASSASSVFSYGSGILCRSRNGVEPCSEHYGEFHAAHAVDMAASMFLVPILFHRCRKDFRNSNGCRLIPIVSIGLNLGLGINDLRAHRHERDAAAILKKGAVRR